MLPELKLPLFLGFVRNINYFLKFQFFCVPSKTLTIEVFTNSESYLFRQFIQCEMLGYHLSSLSRKN